MKEEHTYSILYSAENGTNISCNVHVPTKQLKGFRAIQVQGF